MDDSVHEFTTQINLNSNTEKLRGSMSEHIKWIINERLRGRLNENNKAKNKKRANTSKCSQRSCIVYHEIDRYTKFSGTISPLYVYTSVFIQLNKNNAYWRIRSEEGQIKGILFDKERRSSFNIKRLWNFNCWYKALIKIVLTN